jgi:indolepyruvate ferredoxin oxidoreductase
VSFIDATRLATALLGNSIATNMFMVGYAFQQGALPLSAESIEKAIEMNGEAVAMNQAAFRWGRRAAIDLAGVEKLIPSAAAEDANRRLSQTLDEIVARRVAFLTAYQDAAYARRYSDRVAEVCAAEESRTPGRAGLAEAVARNLFKLMAYKDEYEVARLYADGAFARQVETAFEPGPLRFEFHFAPPLLARRDKITGEPRKMSFGPWMMKAFGLLRRLKALRGTAFDPFGYTAERRTERKLIADYEAVLSEVLGKLDADNHPLAVGLAVIPEKIRGFGHVKLRNLETAKADEAALLEQFRSGAATMLKAAE